MTKDQQTQSLLAERDQLRELVEEGVGLVSYGARKLRFLGKSTAEEEGWLIRAEAALKGEKDGRF